MVKFRIQIQRFNKYEITIFKLTKRFIFHNNLEVLQYTWTIFTYLDKPPAAK